MSLHDVGSQVAKGLTDALSAVEDSQNHVFVPVVVVVVNSNCIMQFKPEAEAELGG